MIRIIPKPTDTPDDNSTQMVIDALETIGADFEILALEEQNPFRIPFKTTLSGCAAYGKTELNLN